MAKKGGAPQNLKPVRTTEEAKKRGRNGGIKSGQVRRAKRDAQEVAKMLLDMPVASQSVENNLKEMFFEEKDFTNRVALIARMYAVAMHGDVAAFRAVMELSGETPQQKINTKRLEMDQGIGKESTSAVDDWVSALVNAEGAEENDGENGGTAKT